MALHGSPRSQIRVLTSTECDVEHRVLHGTDEDGHVQVGVGHRKCAARFLFVSVGLAASTTGSPVTPIEFSGGTGVATTALGPLCVHSSGVTADVHPQSMGAIRSGKHRVVIVGSGKAAIDLLQTLEPSDSILWAHRGHTAFVRREEIHAQYSDDGRSFAAHVAKFKAQADADGEHWSASALRAGWLVACKGASRLINSFWAVQEY